MTTPTPNPGSPEALALKCRCPARDNEHGRGFHGIAGTFVIVEGCPLHDVRPPEEEETR